MLRAASDIPTEFLPLPWWGFALLLTIALCILWVLRIHSANTIVIYTPKLMACQGPMDMDSIRLDIHFRPAEVRSRHVSFRSPISENMGDIKKTM